MPVEASGGTPGLAEGEGLARFGLGFAQVTSPDQHRQAKHLRGGEGEGRAAPAGLTERVLEDQQRLVEIRHRQGDDGWNKCRARGVFPYQCSVGKRAARERRDLAGRPA